MQGHKAHHVETLLIVFKWDECRIHFKKVKDGRKFKSLVVPEKYTHLWPSTKRLRNRSRACQSRISRLLDLVKLNPPNIVLTWKAWPLWTACRAWPGGREASLIFESSSCSTCGAGRYGSAAGQRSGGSSIFGMAWLSLDMNNLKTMQGFLP